MSVPILTSLLWLWCQDRREKSEIYIKELSDRDPKTFLEWYDKSYLTGDKAGPRPNSVDNQPPKED